MRTEALGSIGEPVAAIAMIATWGPAGKGALARRSVFSPTDLGGTVQGTKVEMGLTKREIDAVWKRITRLIEAVDQGEMPAF